MRLINCLMFPDGRKILYQETISNCIILMPGEYMTFIERAFAEQYEWNFRTMKMGFA